MNDMKHTITSQLAVLLLFAAGTVGCSEEDALPGGNTPDSDRCPMTVSVSDGGYTAIHPSAPGTRAAEDSYTTRFTAGDKIGLYAVKDGAIVASNVCLTAETGSSGIAWTGNAYYEGAGTKYYAYYPWQSTLSGSPDASATDASGFFANVISTWTPATDQGTYAKYTAQDLMTGSSTSGSKQPDGTYSLSFTLTHAMALVVIETPTTKYKLTDASGNSLPDYDIPAPDTRFYGFTPYSPAVGTYRYLVKPAQSGAGDLMGSYTATATKEYAVTQNGLTAAGYALYKVDNATVTETSHTLRVGDFYYSDGSIVPRDTQSPPSEGCIGVVYWVGSIIEEDPLLKRDYPGCTHGLVASLQDVGQTLWSSSYEDITSNWLSKQSNTYGIATLKTEDKMQGYANTKALEGYNASERATGEKSGYTVLPIGLIQTYADAHPAPASSSGWYFPSVKELKFMCWGQNASGGTDGKKKLNEQFGKITGGSSLQSDNYWSSAENGSRWAWYVGFNDGGVHVYYKNSDSYWVRAVLAF